ncbi:hypothetical protein D0439_08955 [Lysinibacillus fusiformis]|nr:hypothetical protein CH314_09225 [Lysinibacillus fusiformis]KGA80886.1 hypothetical protein KQ41_18865 [Lysinibacillus fusiformis]QEA01321.1 hypothetical protein D0439_08955 [Lysinibacillus fusiformis]
MEGVLMKLVLQISSYILFITAIVFSLSQISILKEEKEDMEYWEEAAKEHYDNNLIEERYFVFKNIYSSHLTTTLVSAIFMVLTGIFFLAIAKIIALLQDINSKVTNKPQEEEFELLN